MATIDEKKVLKEEIKKTEEEEKKLEKETKEQKKELKQEEKIKDINKSQVNAVEDIESDLKKIKRFEKKERSVLEELYNLSYEINDLIIKKAMAIQSISTRKDRKKAIMDYQIICEDLNTKLDSLKDKVSELKKLLKRMHKKLEEVSELKAEVEALEKKAKEKEEEKLDLILKRIDELEKKMGKAPEEEKKEIQEEINMLKIVKQKTQERLEESKKEIVELEEIPETSGKVSRIEKKEIKDIKIDEELPEQGDVGKERKKMLSEVIKEILDKASDKDYNNLKAWIKEAGINEEDIYKDFVNFVKKNEKKFNKLFEKVMGVYKNYLEEPNKKNDEKISDENTKKNLNYLYSMYCFWPFYAENIESISSLLNEKEVTEIESILNKFNENVTKLIKDYVNEYIRRKTQGK